MTILSITMSLISMQNVLMRRNRFIELVKEADSRYKVCGEVLCDTEKINEYIVNNCKMDDEADDEEKEFPQ